MVGTTIFWVVVVLPTLLMFGIGISAHDQGDGGTSCPSRVAMLEYRLAMLETRASLGSLCPSPSSGPGPAQCQWSLPCQTTRVGEELEECERGMGDDVTKWYPPYVVMNHSSINKQILCDSQTAGGGWIIIQRRAKGDVNFFRGWADYRTGFGHPTGDFWLGNEAIHQLTDEHKYELRIDLRSGGEELFAEYSSFKIEAETDKYRLLLGSYSGTVGESNFGLSYQNNSQFTTFDGNNAVGTSVNCGIEYRGAWWYNQYCGYSNLNGLWGLKDNTGVSWKNGDGYIYPTFTEMKIRRVSGNTSG